MSERHPFYEGLATEQVALYQFFLNRVFESVDVWNYTMWSASRDFDRDRMRADDAALRQIVMDEGTKAGIDASFLSMMFHQYVFADTMIREIHKKNWVAIVTALEHPGYFPDPRLLAGVLEKVSGESP